MRRFSRVKSPPDKESGVILIACGVGVLCACFLPPRATIVLLSLLLTLAGISAISKSKGGSC